MKVAIIVAVHALVWGSAATQAQPPEAAPKEKKICRTVDPVIGSNLPRRSCKTREEWAEQAKRDQATQKRDSDVAKLRDMSTQYSTPH